MSQKHDPFQLSPTEPQTTDMIKGKFKRAVLRRDSDTAPFRPAPPVAIESKKSDASIPTSELSALSRPRTRDDDNIFVNTGKISPVMKETPKFSRRSTFSEESPLRGAFTDRSGPYDRSANGNELKGIEELIDKLNIGKIGDFMKRIMMVIWNKLQNSKYVNSENDGRVHLQSFCIGVIMTSIVVMIQPFLVVYLDSWIVLLGRLLKHLMAWVFVAAVLSYAFTSSKKSKADMSVNGTGELRLNNFEKLQYRVKNSNNSSRSTSPTKSLRGKLASGRPSFSRPSFSQSSVSRGELASLNSNRRDSLDTYNEQLLLMNITERTQLDEKTRMGMMENYDRPKDNYEKFMDVAYKKTQEHDVYNKFVNDSRENIKNLQKHNSN